jgi:hypothetical protein
VAGSRLAVRRVLFVVRVLTMNRDQIDYQGLFLAALFVGVLWITFWP